MSNHPTITGIPSNLTFCAIDITSRAVFGKRTAVTGSLADIEDGLVGPQEALAQLRAKFGTSAAKREQLYHLLRHAQNEVDNGVFALPGDLSANLDRAAANLRKDFGL